MKRANNTSFHLEDFSSGASLGGEVSRYQDKQNIYTQGEPAETLFYIQKGAVRLSTRMNNRPSAVTAILGVGDFFGELCLADYPHRMCTAVALTDSSIRTIKKEEMLQLIRMSHKASNSCGPSADQHQEVPGSGGRSADIFCRSTAGARAFAVGALGQERPDGR